VRLYCLVAFWFCALGMAVRFGYICHFDYPRTSTFNAGEDIGVLIIQIAFFVWLGNILWGWL
jgi:hypothetical protein